MQTINENFIDQLYKKFKSHGIHTWFVGTNLFNTWCKILDYIKKNYDNFDNGVIEIKKLENNDNNAKYKIFWNSLDLSSYCGRSIKGKNAINQYINFALAIKLLNQTNNEFKYKFNTIVFDKVKRIDSKNVILYFISELLKDFFYKKFKIDNKYSRNICCSIIFEIIYQVANKNMKPFIENTIINLKSKHTKNIHEKIDRFTLQSGYKDIIDNFSTSQRNYLLYLIFSYFNIENDNNIFIDDLALYTVCNSCNNANRNFSYGVIKKYLIECINNRKKLRENIISNCVGNKDEYSDFKNVDNRHIDDLEACHIKEVRTIKKQDNIINDEYFDFNNGLMMNRDTHYLFDKRIFTFNSNDGKILFNDNSIESKKRVAIAFKVGIDKVDSIQIKRLTKKMALFLKQR